MKNKKEIFSVIDIILIFIMIGSLYYCLKNKKTYELKLPNAEILEKITIKGDNTKTIEKETEIKKLLDNLSKINRITQKESVQDTPVKATNIITINCTFKTAGNSVIFAYKKKNKYYMEEPYNGIYDIKEEDYNYIRNFIEQNP